MPKAKKDIPWPEIRDAYLLGESSVSIGERFKVNHNTIRCRASREKWATPRNVHQKLAREITRTKAAELRGQLTPEQAQARMNDIQHTQKTLQQRQQEHRDNITDILGVQLGKTKLPPIKSYRDLDIADKIQRRALDMDKETPNAIVNVGILSGGAIIDEEIDSEPDS